ncbi:biotin/lipoyl-containing protein [Thermoanaerobacterium thermosaccharolyticum]|uniref:biotin/lipoyl-containing protein n=1 Tax=Thermoanaerobacterium thermosaccharolyticum TaxID=1517 RepID=UPI003DA89002
MKKFIVTVNGKKYDVEVEELKNYISDDKKSAEEMVVEKENTPSSSNQSQIKPTQEVPKGAVSVNAPMPGTILDVKVSVGQSVKRGDVLLILEAMKMENEITAPQDGVVAAINISKGASVNTGDVLLSLR